VLEIGRIVRPHGLRGEVVVELISNRPDRLVKGAAFEVGDRELVVSGVRAHKGRWLVMFEGVDSKESAELTRGFILSGEPPDDPNAGDPNAGDPNAGDPNEGDQALWVHRLIGSKVLDQTDAEVGTVVSIEANPASDLLVLDTGGLIPCRFVASHAGGEVHVDIPEGLLDL
jgi:16S rRNA processing protein RimM